MSKWFQACTEHPCQNWRHNVLAIGVAVVLMDIVYEFLVLIAEVIGR